MSQGEYKVNEIIEVTYQASGSTSGLTDVTMEIYDETRAKDGVNFPDVTMTEIGSTGRYYGTFTPDAVGKWRIMVDSATKPGRLVKDYDVVAHNIDSIGSAVDGLNDVSTVEIATELETYDAVKKSELDTSESNIRGVDNDTLKSISDQIDSLPQTSPPMIG